MAFETLRRVLGSEFLARREFERNRPLFEERLKELRGAATERELKLAQLIESARARQRVSEFMSKVASTPYESIVPELSKSEAEYVNNIAALGDPEALRLAQNKVKFSALLRKFPNVAADISAAYPDLVQSVSGIGKDVTIGSDIAMERERRRTALDVESERAIGDIEKEVEKEKERRKTRLAEIHEQLQADLAKIALKAMLDKQKADDIIRSGRAAEPERVKAASDIIEQLIKEASLGPLEGEDDNAYTKRLRLIFGMINKFSDYIDSVAKGEEAKFPKISKEEFKKFATPNLFTDPELQKLLEEAD